MASWRSRLGVASVALLAAVCVATFHPSAPISALHPRIDDGYTSQVFWDGYSFSIRTSTQASPRRIFLRSGEMHPWRIPVPDLWHDICKKAKAAGLNSISIYMHWGMMNPKEGILDLEGINDFQPLFDAAKAAGLWVIARPGPYINSETSGGGIPGWVTTLQGDPSWSPYNGELRSNDTAFHNAWKPYIEAMAKLVVKNQVTRGGPIIMLQVENEYYNGVGQNEYILQLQKAYRDAGVVVPTMVNDPGLYRNLVNETDIYTVDAYPLGSSCTGMQAWRDIPTTWRPYHEEVMPNTPFMFTEFQGGQYDKWGGVGYDTCREVTGAACVNPNHFERVYHQQLWAHGVTAINLYMFFGGTNWGQLPYPMTYTSYDIGAVKETRELTPKYDELKLQSFFLASTPDIYKTHLVSNGTNMTNNANLFTTWLRNPDSGVSFFINRQLNASWTDVRLFRLDIGNLTLPQLGGDLVLNGRDSRIVSVNLAFGTKSKLLYSTAHIMTSMAVDGSDVLVVYGDKDQTVELSFASSSSVEIKTELSVKTQSATDATTLNAVISSGISTIRLIGPKIAITVIVAEYQSATAFWQPSIAGSGPFAAYTDVSATTPVLVVGPYLVRTAVLRGDTLELIGDLNQTTVLQVFGPAAVHKVDWNGKRLALEKAPWGALQAVLPGPEKSIAAGLPSLKVAKWKYADSLPEITPAYDDRRWVDANRTDSTSLFPRYYGGPWNLSVASDYGYHVGNILWRGHFNGAGQRAVNLSISGGQHFVATAWVNDQFLGATKNSVVTDNVTWLFPPGAVKDGDNVVTVLQDHMGFNLAGMVVCCTPGGRQRDIQQPRGIEGYYLLGENGDADVNQFSGWKVQGNIGGENYPDKTRKIFNEGGLYGERMGYHLPGYDDSKWPSKAPWDGLKRAGVAWFRATFKLELPEGYDVPLSIVFADAPGNYRAQLYVNGWQMGKRAADLGPQTAFRVQPGILDLRGQNTLAISLWSLGNDAEDLVIPSIKLVAGTVYSGGPGKVRVDNPAWKERHAW